ncbi:MAG TPA: sigma-70 family RNA polymerase sigma factor [Acidimicrobiales bacterium]|nr:sigma-70 family RNA polymerase sigma factor [Acidimicrobiales bacterium]
MTDWVAGEFEDSRPRLRGIAYRMLGSTAEADDAVQEAWIRLNRTGAESIDNLGGWLTTVVSRVCLDMLRSRRDEPAGVSLPEPMPTEAGPVPGSGDPEGTALVADSIGPALLLVLDSLDPDQRLAFVLHDLFGVPFGEIAPIVGRSSEATRQLASRARRRLRGASEEGPGATSSEDLARQRQLVDAFLAASREGDFDALVSLLDSEVVLRTDPVAVRAAAARRSQGAPPLKEVLRGGKQVARTFLGSAAAAQPALVDGLPGAVWAPGGKPRGVFAFTWRDGRVVELEIIADPRRIRALDIVL